MGSELECKAKVLFANVSFIFTRGGGGGHLGIFRVGMCRPGHQIGIPF